MKSPAKIIFNADDLGMGDDIDKGIFHAAAQRLIHSASASVVNGVSSETLIRFVKIAEPNSLGLHINLTDGVPAAVESNTRSLIQPNGSFKTALDLLGDSSLSVNILYREMAAQLERFVKMTGSKPSHIDSHQHFTYLHPAAFSAFLRLAEQERIKIRSPRPFLKPDCLRSLVISTEERFKVQIPFAPEERAQELAEIFQKYEVTQKTTDCFLGFPKSRINQEKSESGTTIEIVCHPRYSSSGFIEVEELSHIQRS